MAAALDDLTGHRSLRSRPHRLRPERQKGTEASPAKFIMA